MIALQLVGAGRLELRDGALRRAYGGARAGQRRALALAQVGKLAVDVRPRALADGLQAVADLEAGNVPGRAVLVP
jgi:propanol-preferring alcohol dehydrogenase